MTKVSSFSSSKAREIAQALDNYDGKDGKITSNTWNNVFKAKEKGGNEIRSQISVFNAEKSIKYYLNKNFSENEENDLATAWLDSVKDVATPKVAEQDAKEKTESPKQKVELSELQLKPITEPAVSTAVNKVPESVILGETSAKITPEALAKTFDKVTLMNEISDLIRQELAKKGVDESTVDIPYWAERIGRVSSRFSIPKEIVVSIISKETLFAKNISNRFGKGAMALTGIAIRSFFPSEKGNWYDVYKKLDSDLLNDILYKKDKYGNMITDSNGQPILKYKSSQELLAACGKDDELSMKVGSLVFEMKYAEAVTSKKMGRATYANIPKVIDQLKSGELQLSENENIACVGAAIKNYNGCDTIVKRHGRMISIKEDYKQEVMDSLKVHGYNFAEQNIIKPA